MPVFQSLECYASVDIGDNKAKQLAARSLAFAKLPNDQSTTDSLWPLVISNKCGQGTTQMVNKPSLCNPSEKLTD